MKKLRIALTALMLVALLPIAVSPVFAALQEQHHQFQNVDKEWSKGNINPSNSDYVEGDSIPYRYEFNGVPAGAYLEFEIHYDFTRGGKYAFDFLTSVKRTESSVIDSLSGGLFSSPLSPLTSLTESDCDFTALAIPNDPNISTDDLVIGSEGTQYFTICGDFTDATVDVPTHPSDVSGNSEKVITLRVQADPNGDAEQELAIAWGGHLAIGDEANWGVGNGAGSISGAPFHQNGDGFLDVNGNGERDLPDDKELGDGDRSVNEVPTAVTGPGSSFNAEASTGRVNLTWETETEVDNAGFNLYRALLKDGPYTQINEALIAAEGGAVAGASYSFLDRPYYGTFYYKLEDVNLYGVSTLHGPVKVTLARRPLRSPLYRPNLPEF